MDARLAQIDFAPAPASKGQIVELLGPRRLRPAHEDDRQPELLEDCRYVGIQASNDVFLEHLLDT